jgi:hypothetical protein
MEVQRSKAGIRFWGVVLLSVGWSMAFASPIAGQRGGDPAKAQMQEMTQRELQLKHVGEERQRPNDPRRAQALMNQVAEDFDRILTLHNQIVRTIAADESLNYEFISEAMGEIRRRSARLQSSLKLARPEHAAENRAPASALNVTETKDVLILLCKQIESFVKNPIIATPGTVDARELERARKDLDSVVELSSNIKKLADKQKP